MFPHSIRFNCSAIVRNRFERQILRSTRNGSVLSKLYQGNKVESLEVDFASVKVVYRYNFISFAAGILKLKARFPIYIGIPVPVLFFFTGNQQLAFAVLYLCVINYIFLWQASRFCTNIIGCVYVNKAAEVDKIIVASLDKSGQRVNKSYNPSDLFVLGFKHSLHKATRFVTIAVKDSDIMYKLNVSKCKIYDIETFNFLFKLDAISN